MCDSGIIAPCRHLCMWAKYHYRSGASIFRKTYPYGRNTFSESLSVPNNKMSVDSNLLGPEAQAESHSSPQGICGGHSGTGTGSVKVRRFSPVSNIPPLLHIHIPFICHRHCVILTTDIFTNETLYLESPGS
jgi:hypothetical protein